MGRPTEGGSRLSWVMKADRGWRDGKAFQERGTTGAKVQRTGKGSAQSGDQGAGLGTCLLAGSKLGWG